MQHSMKVGKTTIIFQPARNCGQDWVRQQFEQLKLFPTNESLLISMKGWKKMEPQEGFKADPESLRPLARASDPPTSQEAASRVGPATASLSETVLDAIRAAGIKGATDKEISAATGLSRVTVSPRIAPLVRAGAVKPNGEKRDGCRVLVIA